MNIISLTIVFLLFAACKNANIETTFTYLGSTDFSIVGISDSGPVKSYNGSWSCSGALSCSSFRSIVNSDPNFTFTTEDFNTTNSISLAQSSYTDGNYYLHVQGKSLEGSITAQKTISIIIDNQPPTVSITPPINNLYINIANQNTYTISGTCSENGQSVSVSAGAVTGTATCSANSFTINLDLSSLSEGSISISASQSDLASNLGNSSSVSVTKDSVRPTLSIGGLPNSGIVNSSNQSSYTLSGTCSESSQTINISGALTSTVLCNSGSFSKSLDLSGLSDGSINLSLSLNDVAGNSLLSSGAVNLTKDTSTFSGSVTINSADTYTNSLSVNLSLSSASATEMYITNASGCGSGGAWESMAATKSWTLTTSNSTNTVYAKFKNASGNESPCSSDSIIHDNVSPTLAITAPTAGSYINSLNQSSLTISGSCSENGQTVTVNAGAVSGTTTCSGNAFSKTLDLTSLGDGTVSLTASQPDAATNTGTSAAVNVTKDTNTASIVSIISGEPTSVNNTSVLNITIAGTGVVAYQYKVGISSTTNCSIFTGYSSDVVVGTKITDSISGLADGPITLCVLGKSTAGNYQQVTSASIATWTKDTVALEPSGLTLVSPATSPNTSSSVTIGISGLEQNSTVYLYNDSGCSSQVGTGATGAGVYSKDISVAGLTVGSFDFYAKQIDSSGNSSLCSSSTVHYQMDTAATVSSVSSSVGSLTVSYYKSSSLIPITVNFNKAVIVTGNPRIKLNSGGSVYAVYSGGTGTSTLTFDYTVQSGESTARLDYSTTSALELNGGTIQNNSIDAVLTLPSPGSTNSLSDLRNLLIDTTAPVGASSIVDGSFLNSTSASPAITFTNGTDSGSGIDRHQIQVVLGSNTSTVIKSWADFSSGNTVTGLTLSDGVQYKVQIKAIDKAGNETVVTSDGWSVDVFGPTAPSSLSLGSVPNSATSTPTLSWTASSDNGSGVSYYEAQLFQQGNGTPIKTWTTISSGGQLTSGFTLSHGVQYYFELRAVDQLGNASTTVQSSLWVAINDPCLNSPSPGTVCAGGAIYLGSLNPGATSGSGTDYYMTTPGGCGEIPSALRVTTTNTPYSDYANSDFTPTCSGVDSLNKLWNDGSTSWYDIIGLTNYSSTTGTGFGETNTDYNYGSTNTANIVSITTAAQGGYHAAARYCDKLSYGGYTDWYLPNRFELNLFFINKSNIPGLIISTAGYISSTENSLTSFWVQRFSDGYQSYLVKNSTHLIRCIRKFSPL